MRVLFLLGAFSLTLAGSEIPKSPDPRIVVELVAEAPQIVLRRGPFIENARLRETLNQFVGEAVLRRVAAFGGDLPPWTIVFEAHARAACGDLNGLDRPGVKRTLGHQSAVASAETWQRGLGTSSQEVEGDASDQGQERNQKPERLSCLGHGGLRVIRVQ